MQHNTFGLTKRLNLITIVTSGLAGLLTANGPTQPAWAAYPAGQAGAVPVRMARFSYVSGGVNWRRDSGAQWSAASINLPIRQGAQIWATGRSEIQFDDGSRFRCGGGALVTLQTLYSDSSGEFTELTLTNGDATLRLQHDKSVFQVNTPVVCVNATGPGRFRLNAGTGTQLAVLQGHAEIEGRQGKATFQSGDYIDLQNANSPYDIRPMPASGTYALWSDARDRNLDGYATSRTHRNLPANIALVADDLDAYGTWQSDPRYGDVWCPRHSGTDWRPYSQGSWVWADPYGWTWVDQEPWGWAPSHYGTWIHGSYGWGWVHGPAVQYWSPGVVAFSDYGGSQCWAALAPQEVVYPSSFGVGFSSGNLSLYFSIGQAGVYYPGQNNRYSGDAWSSGFVNQWSYSHGGTNGFNGGRSNWNSYRANSGYVPFNARSGGAMMVSSGAFGGRGGFRTVPQGSVNNVFSHGRRVGAPPRGQFAASGPSAIRPTQLSMTPARGFNSNVRVPPAVIARTVYRTPLQPAIARDSTPGIRTFPVNASPRTFARTKAGSAVSNAAFTGKTSRPLRASGNIARPIRPGTPGPRQAGMTSPGSARARVTPPRAMNVAPSGAERANKARQSLGMHSNAGKPNVSSSSTPSQQRQRAANAAQQRQHAAASHARQPAAAPRQHRTAAPRQQQRTPAPRQQQRTAAPRQQQRTAAPRQQQRPARSEREQRR